MENQKANTSTNQQKPSIMHSFKEAGSIVPMKKALVIVILLSVLGAGTGYALSRYSSSTGNDVPILPKKNTVATGQTFGSDDTETFKDTAEGVLKEGGIDGEGQYHLERPGGESQNVYMTSSTVDLSKFKGKKIKVWGQTQAAQKAGWLMDVGRVEVL
jgi:hypothetical protein